MKFSNNYAFNRIICFWCLSNWSLLSYSFNLTILHNNDIHTHFEPTDKQNSQCDSNETCYGGIARTVTKVKQIIEERRDENVLFLNTGDNFAGSIWFTLEKWKVVAEFTKFLKFDAMTLGNHEFDDGLNELLPFIKEMANNEVKNVSIVSTNVVISGEMKRYLKPSVVLKKGKTLIGVVGCTTPKTAFLSLTGKDIKFNDEIQSLNEEIQNLKKKYGKSLNIFIALSHSGFDKDKEIAEKVPELDIVIGGHTNTFLYTGKPPASEKVAGPYPIVIPHKNNGKTLIVSAFAFAKYLGLLEVSFDKNGIITHYGGNPILLEQNIEEDPQVLEKVQERAKIINEHYNKVIGMSLVDFDASKCAREECSIGNLFNDAFVSYFVQRRNLTESGDKGWTSVAIAVYNGGSIRSGFGGSNITRKDVISALPFNNNLGILKVNGSKLWDIMEHSASQYRNGGFLQVSGIKYCFDSSQPIGKRLRSVRVRCSDCQTPAYQDLDMDKTYAILMTKYLVEGGDDFKMISGSQFHKFNEFDYEYVFDYIEKYSPIVTGIEDRIIDSKTDCSGAHSIKSGKEEESGKTYEDTTEHESESIE